MTQVCLPLFSPVTVPRYQWNNLDNSGNSTLQTKEIPADGGGYEEEEETIVTQELTDGLHSMESYCHVSKSVPSPKSICNVSTLKFTKS